jgi:hypothetical protein
VILIADFLRVYSFPEGLGELSRAFHRSRCCARAGDHDLFRVTSRIIAMKVMNQASRAM